MKRLKLYTQTRSSQRSRPAKPGGCRKPPRLPRQAGEGPARRAGTEPACLGSLARAAGPAQRPNGEGLVPGANNDFLRRWHSVSI